jgi:hypothetical protein
MNVQTLTYEKCFEWEENIIRIETNIVISNNEDKDVKEWQNYLILVFVPTMKLIHEKTCGKYKESVSVPTEILKMIESCKELAQKINIIDYEKKNVFSSERKAIKNKHKLFIRIAIEEKIVTCNELKQEIKKTL